MAWKSGIWNALPDAEGDYDRKYNGDDYSDPLGYIIGNGIVVTNNGDSVKVNSEATISGTTYGLTIRSGWGWINGKWFYNPTDDSTSIVNIAAPTQGNKRYDRLVVRRDNRIANGRIFYPYLIQGEQVAEGTPIKPEITRNENYYDLCIAEMLVTRGDTVTVSISDMRNDKNLCGFCNGYFGDNFNEYMATLESVFNSKMSALQDRADNWADNTSLTQGIVYNNTVTLSAASNTVSIGIASYQYGVDTLDVYTNGEKEYETKDYTINSNGTVTFTETKAAGAVVYFEVTKYVDGTTDVTNAYAEIENTNKRVEALENFSSEYNYLCNGSTDNVEISRIVKAFLNANNTDYKTLELKIYGTLGVKTAVSGTGATNNAYKWFDFSPTNTSNRRVIVDFNNCTGVTVPIANATNNILFFYGGGDITVKNITITANNTNSTTTIQGSSGTGKIVFDNIRAWITAYGNCTFATRGKFDNCRINCTSTNGNVTIFNPTGTDLVEVNGGEYYAYEANGTYSAVVYHGTDSANAVTILNGVRMPTSARSGYSQTNGIRINNGYVSMINCITALPNTTAAAATVANYGTIPVSR